MTALFVALGGSAYALTITGASIVDGSVRGADIKNGSVRGSDIKNHSLTGRDMKNDSVGGLTVNEARLGPVPAAESLTHSAVVGPLGQNVRGRGVTSVARTDNPGRYQVIFNRDVRGCVYSATVGDVGADNPPGGQVSVGGLAASPNGVAVRTTDSAGNLANRPFHLLVSC
ncbi:MAG: hypothetical protein LC749_08485 [Actinobacteria bacterium]|nr:hypothetical protein [Actinomycetota bacterium]